MQKTYRNNSGFNHHIKTHEQFEQNLQNMPVPVQNNLLCHIYNNHFKSLANVKRHCYSHKKKNINQSCKGWSYSFNGVDSHNMYICACMSGNPQKLLRSHSSSENLRNTLNRIYKICQALYRTN